ncbi:helicase-exonuclease AddAB subunit AddA [Caldalkalibacillus mannanilyticus]|uniref:helicase-exonuclease AddAB subunit AddA n=1 Tax=Caldalkalibacillus mannanilyticus TaxID=1418 RepID=UPI00046A5316|nr:helicase-exonuclease AddAB subunit AddA [Caldalkalibacillus mannanilyticus]
MSKMMMKPVGSTWTDEQWQAIVARGQDILVAAAAGSGKTAVLVERIIRRIVDHGHPVDVDRLLIVTFTNAAAAEMKKRIGEALEKELVKDPDSLYLKRQLTLLNRASISTLHSFCLEVLKKYYYMIDIDPKFRIADDIEVELLREEVVEELLEEQYSIEGNEAFFRFIDSFSSDRTDRDIYTLILSLYEFSRSHPFPSQWLDQLLERYLVTEDQPQHHHESWTSDLLDDLRLQFSGLIDVLCKGLEITMLPGGPAPYADNLEQDIELLSTLLKASDEGWEATFAAFQERTFSKLKACKSEAVDKTLQEKVKSLREKVKKQVAKLKSEWFQRPLQEYMEDIIHMSAPISALVELTKEFSQRYALVKKQKGIVDFSDLEHFCLAILLEQHENAGSLSIPALIPSPAAQDYREKFIEVMVDEYQDTNLVQESIIQLITRGDTGQGNLFMVGDVKQSIYRFRLADPNLFLQKYKTFRTFVEQQELDVNPKGLRIDLAKNFRSREQVLEGTNFLFKQIMNESVGEIEYNEAAALKVGADYPVAENMEVEVFLITRTTPQTEPSFQGGEEAVEDQELVEGEIEQEDLEAVQLEARMMAQKMKELLGKEQTPAFQVFDPKNKLLRPIQYRDMVILLRATSVWAPTIVEELKKQGIPVHAELNTGYFEATEIAVLLSLLKVIDNPFQDIPLASVLRSPLVGLDEEQLAQIRLHKKKGPYYSALRSYVQEVMPTEEEFLCQKLSHFLENLQQWRTQARQGALSELIWAIYKQTGYYDFVGGLPGGNQRQANLKALYDRARQYEATSFRGLFRFLNFIERMQDKGRDLGAARALGEQEDVVRIMTIHKSKGLEFPVVFVAGLAKQFNMMDVNRKYLMHKDLGFGCKFVDVEKRISYPMLPQMSIKRRVLKEMLAEEMRILYVALTRAKEKLYLTGTISDADKVLDQWSTHIEHEEWILGDYDRLQARCYLDWIGPALVRHRDAKGLRVELDEDGNGKHMDKRSGEAQDVFLHPSEWSIQWVDSQDLMLSDSIVQQGVDEKIEQALARGERVPLSSESAQEIERILSWKYPFAQATYHLAKQSVSELKRTKKLLFLEDEEHFIQPEFVPLRERPAFLKSARLSAAEKGTSMHTVMQHLPLDRKLEASEIAELLDELHRKEILTELERESIAIEYILQFYQSQIGEFLLQEKDSIKIYKELPFNVGIQASEVFPDWTGEDERVIIQGVIDCLVAREDGLILIDYKTDNISERFEGDFNLAKKTMLERYQEQIRLYSYALSVIWNQPIIGKYLYFFDGGHIIRFE